MTIMKAKGSTLLVLCFMALEAWFGSSCGGDDSDDGGEGGAGAAGVGGTQAAGAGGALCRSQLDCSEGHACLLVDDSGPLDGSEPTASVAGDPHGFCDRLCSPDVCSPRACASATGTCAASGCKASTECGSSDFCETSSHTCRSAAGMCASVAECLVTKKVRAVAVVSCDGSCQLSPRETSTVTAPFVGQATLSVKAPRAGAALQDLAKFSFRFDRSADAGFALIVKAPSNADSEPNLDDAIWGAVLAPGVDHCSWSSGTDVVLGKWQPALSAAPGEGRYYFVIQSVKLGALTGFSDLVPFVIGPPPLDLGDVCHDNGVVAGECVNPDLLMGCLEGRCAQVCSSHAACEPLTCADPINGVRYCE